MCTACVLWLCTVQLHVLCQPSHVHTWQAGMYGVCVCAHFTKTQPATLGHTLTHWITPHTLGHALIHWGTPSHTGTHPPTLGYTLPHWDTPSHIGAHPPTLGHTLPYWDTPSCINAYIAWTNHSIKVMASLVASPYLPFAGIYCNNVTACMHYTLYFTPLKWQLDPS